MIKLQWLIRWLSFGLMISLGSLIFKVDNAEARAGYSANDKVQLPAHDKRALEKLNREAQAGNVKAAYDLGTLYLWGGGLKQDLKLSEQWFRKAAEAGYRPAQLYLASGYGSEFGLAGALPRDHVEGLRWMLVAISVQKDPLLEVKIALLKQQMTPAQIAEAEQRACGHSR